MKRRNINRQTGGIVNQTCHRRNCLHMHASLRCMHMYAFTTCIYMVHADVCVCMNWLDASEYIDWMQMQNVKVYQFGCTPSCINWLGLPQRGSLTNIVPTDVQIVPRSGSGLCRSASSGPLIVPGTSKKTFGDRAFTCSGPNSWNSLSTLDTVVETIVREWETRENERRSLECLIAILILIAIARVWETIACRSRNSWKLPAISMCCLLWHSWYGIRFKRCLLWR